MDRHSIAQFRTATDIVTRQLATDRPPDSFQPLVEQVAYEGWHRMLFARFLAENHLLIHPEWRVPGKIFIPALSWR